MVKKYMNTIVGLKELRENMKTYVRQVEMGRSFTVVKKSKPIFKVVPVDTWGDEGIWENLDLRDKNGKGMSAIEFLKMFRKYNKK